MIVSSLNFLGVKIFERKRVFEEEIDLTFEKFHCEDIGIYLVGQYPKLKYNHISITNTHEWNKLAYETFSLTILDLINKNIVKIVQVEDVKSYFSNTIKINSNNYVFKINKSTNQEVKDLFARQIINFIHIAHIKHGLKTDISKIIRLVLNKYLGDNEEYSRPAKHFLIKNLGHYAKNFDWITIEKKKKLFGIYKDYQLDIKEIYIPRIKIQHDAARKTHRSLYKSNSAYRKFSDELRNSLEKDFSMREPSHDADMD